MRIQHNIMAMSAYRNYTNNVSAMQKNLEKLSSGYKINRAGDDAAGLAISEKMRAQISGLEAAQKNAKDGISLVQTAEGALTEVHDMLNRMVTLATQSANGTYDNETDRYQLQKELDQLRDEIDRIADSSNFNGIKLLNGDMTESTSKTTYEYTFDSLATLTILTGAATVAGTFAGSSTILHKDSEGASLTSFEVDLRKTAVKTTTTAVAISLGVGGGTIGINASALKGDTTYDGKALADLFAESVGNTGVSINGVSYNVSVADDGVLRFEMDEKSAANITNAASFSITISEANACTIVAGTGQTLKSDNVDDLIQNYKIGSLDEGTVYASTETNGDFFTTANVKDGAGIKVGNEVYVFALTKETLAKDFGGAKVVDLTDCLTTAGAFDAANKKELAASKFSQAAADNEMFRVGVGQDGRISFRERLTYSGDADLTTLDGIKAQLQRFNGVSATSTTETGGGKGALTLQIGDTAEDFNQLKVEIKDCHVDAIGVGDISIADQASAAAAIDKIKAAINYVSDVRGTLGATQNRLDHTMNNLSVMTENIQDAESTIRDVDVAEEMMAYTKNNILIQSAQAMLAQANQVPQGVLQLLG